MTSWPVLASKWMAMLGSRGRGGESGFSTPGPFIYHFLPGGILRHARYSPPPHFIQVSVLWKYLFCSMKLISLVNFKFFLGSLKLIRILPIEVNMTDDPFNLPEPLSLYRARGRRGSLREGLQIPSSRQGLLNWVNHLVGYLRISFLIHHLVILECLFFHHLQLFSPRSYQVKSNQFPPDGI